MKALIWLVKAKFSYVYILIKFNFIKIIKNILSIFIFINSLNLI